MSKDIKKPKTVGLSQKVLAALKKAAIEKDRSESWIVNDILARELGA